MAESATSVGSLTFLGLFAMFSLSPRFTLYASYFFTRPGRELRECPRWFATDDIPCAVPKRSRPPACPLRPETSYWLGGTNEMAAINTILIIVNSATP
jgi:hypothetical protein